MMHSHPSPPIGPLQPHPSSPSAGWEHIVVIDSESNGSDSESNVWRDDDVWVISDTETEGDTCTNCGFVGHTRDIGLGMCIQCMSDSDKSDVASTCRDDDDHDSHPREAPSSPWTDGQRQPEYPYEYHDSWKWSPLTQDAL